MPILLPSPPSLPSLFPATPKPQILRRQPLPFSSFAGRRRPILQRLASGYLFDLGVLEADSLAEYDVARIAAIFKHRPFLVVRRLFQIGTTFGKWFALRYVDGLMERSDQMFKIRAAELRKIIAD